MTNYVTKRKTRKTGRRLLRRRTSGGEPSKSVTFSWFDGVYPELLVVSNVEPSRRTHHFTAKHMVGNSLFKNLSSLAAQSTPFRRHETNSPAQSFLTKTLYGRISMPSSVKRGVFSRQTMILFFSLGWSFLISRNPFM